MTNAQLEQATAIVPELLDQSAAVRDNVLAEMATLASTNPDPVPDDEFEGLVRHLVFKYRKAADDAAAAADNPGAAPDYVAPAETLVNDPAVVDDAIPVSAWRGPAPEQIFDGAAAEADLDGGTVVLTLEDSRQDIKSRAYAFPVRLTLSAVAEVGAALGFALDELLTPGVDCGWTDEGPFGAVLMLNDPAKEVPEKLAEIHRDDETGLYQVTLYRGVENPAGAAIAAVPTIETAKFLASKAARANLQKSTAE